jgi:iron complex outermembrane receptor protein
MRSSTAAAARILVAGVLLIAMGAPARTQEDRALENLRALAAIEARLSVWSVVPEADRDSIRREVERLGRAIEPGGPAAAPSAPTDGELPVADLALRVSRLRERVLADAGGVHSPSGSVFFLGRVEVEVEARGEDRPGKVTVSQAEMTRLDRRDVAAALILAPGVAPTRAGSRNESGVRVRGFDLRQVPLFVDGIPVYVPYDGYLDVGRLPVSDLAEIRLTKGFGSVFYGANALGGTINLVSRRPGKAVEADANARLGSGGERSAFANAGGRRDHGYVQAGLAWTEADGFPLSGDFEPQLAEDGELRDNAFHEDLKLSLKLGLLARGGDEYALSVAHQRGDKGTPSYAGHDPSVRPRYWQWPSLGKGSVYFASHTRLTGRAHLKLRGYYDSFSSELRSFDDASYSSQNGRSSFTSFYDDESTGAVAEVGALLGRQSLRAAGHLKLDRHQEYNAGEAPRHFEDRVASLAVQGDLSLSGRLSAVAALRFDSLENRQAEELRSGVVTPLPQGEASGWNPQLALAWRLSAGTLQLGLTQTTRLPTLKDRYSYRLGQAIPSPDLDPERAMSVELAYHGRLARRFELQAAAFVSDIENLVERVYIQPNLYQMQNVGRARHAGLEIGFRGAAGSRVDWWASYAFLDRRSLAEPPVPLVDAARHRWLGGVQLRPVSKLSLVASLESDSGRAHLNQAGRLLEQPGFTLVDLKARYDVRRGLTLEAGATNLLDQNIELDEGYPGPGRAFFAGLRFAY